MFMLILNFISILGLLLLSWSVIIIFFTIIYILLCKYTNINWSWKKAEPIIWAFSGILLGFFIHNGNLLFYSPYH